MRSKRVWIILMDGAKARILEKSGKKISSTPLYDVVQDHCPSRLHEADRPGRVFERKGEVRHAYESRVHWHSQQKEVLAQHICDLLKEKDQEGNFEELQLIAPPKTMGSLRLHLSPSLKEKTTKELTKDLMNLPLAELIAYLEVSL